MDEKKYRRLVSRTMPRILESEGEYQILLGQIEKLEKDEATLSLEGTRLLSLLATVAEQYESRANPTSQAAPHHVLVHLMESHGLRHRDIREPFGSGGPK
jgi:HTH-type transcriptional regulator / antitoxin HigA